MVTSKRYLIWAFMLVGCFAICTRSEVEEQGPSWKYLVERTVNDWDGLTKKKEVHIDRAFVYYGAGAKQAGGQRRGVPQVVYVDESRKRLPKGDYFESPFVPRSLEKLTLTGKFPDNQGLERDFPLPAAGLPKAFDVFPLKPEAELREKSRWNFTWYLMIDDYRPEAMFPATISHEVTGYKKKLGRKCAVIEYAISGEFKSDDHPELLTEKERQMYKGQWHLKGNGIAYFDPAEEIIVEKEQTLSYTSFSEIIQPLEAGKFDSVTTEKEALELVKSGLEDGSIGWATTVDKGRTVAISVSLIPEEGPTSRLVVYLLVIGGAGIVIAVVVLLRKKKASTGEA